MLRFQVFTYRYENKRAEATFQTIEAINADPKILPGIKLGVEIRDDCWYAPVALEQTLEFIRDAVATPISSSASSSSVSNGANKPSSALVSLSSTPHTSTESSGNYNNISFFFFEK